MSVVFGIDQLLEISAVLMNRFHYTMDIIMALLLVLLWYTNGPMSIFSQWWKKFGEPSHNPLTMLPDKKKEFLKIRSRILTRDPFFVENGDDPIFELVKLA